MNKLFDLAGRRALITGSSQGIGLALAAGLQQAGAEVVLNGRSVEKLESAARSLGAGARMLAFDVTDHAAVKEAVDRFEADDDAWVGVFMGEGFDPVDGAHRVRLLRRAQDAVYAGVRLALEPDAPEQLGAVGCACFSHGLVGVHGMRTRPRFRGRGLARQLMAAMGVEAQRRGIVDAFLQVEVENHLARSLYARIGFEPAWTYVYWQQPSAG